MMGKRNPLVKLVKNVKIEQKLIDVEIDENYNG